MASVELESRELVRTKTPGVYKRGSRYQVRYRDMEGRQRARSARTYREACELRKKLGADVARGEYREQARVTFVEYARTWADTYTGRTSRGIRPETLADYRKALGVLTAAELEAIEAKARWCEARIRDRTAMLARERSRGADATVIVRVEAQLRSAQVQLEKLRHRGGAVGFFGRSQLAAIEPRHVKQYAAELAGRGLSPGSVRNLLAPLRALFATAFEEGVIRSNPTAGVRIAAPHDFDADGQEVKAKALSEDELLRLLDELSADWRLFVAFLAHTGLRIGEAIALQWKHIDLGRRRVLVRRRLYRGRFDSPKSRYGRRDVPLTESMARALWRVRGTRVDEELVFPSAAGTPLEPSNLAERVFKPAARSAGVPWASFHSLRHTCASLLFTKAKKSPKEVQMWLGHHSPAFTLATYVHLLPDDLSEAPELDLFTHGSTEGSPRPAETSRDAVAAGTAG